MLRPDYPNICKSPLYDIEKLFELTSDLLTSFYLFMKDNRP